MSYILDALRKAEAERERGTVPSIHAQPVFAGAQPASAPTRSRLWIVLLAVGGLVALVVAFAFYGLLGRSPASEVVAPVATRPAPAPVAAAPVASAPAPVAIAPASTATPAPAQATPQPTPRPRLAPTTTVAAKPAPAPAPLPAASKPDERIYAASELPDDIRRQLPALAVGGSMYSPTPKNRLVIINGQVLHEGDRISPDLMVERIRLKTAVLAFKGYRYTLAF